MATTPNYGWVTPAPTDFVTDLPADFETFADAVDADLAGLLGGTTGQVLTKASGTDHDFAFADATSGGMTQIATGSLTGSSVSLTSIPATYKDLYLILTDVSLSANGSIGITVNNITTSTYTTMMARYAAATSSADVAGVGAGTAWRLGLVMDANKTRNLFAITIPNYTNTTQLHSFSGHGAYESSLGGNGRYATAEAGTCSGTAGAINRVDILATYSGAYTFDNGTYILYGVS
jgi:hypothetical protein